MRVSSVDRGGHVKRFLKWLGIGAGALVLLAALLVATVYVLSERAVHRTYDDVPLTNITVPHDAESIAKGKHLATIYGCNNCHGDRLQGLKMHDDPQLGRFVAPNLTRVVREYSDAELERVLRHGVTRDGKSTWVMPSDMFQHMSDEDLGQVIAFLRSVPAVEGPSSELTFRYLARIGIATGKFRPHASTIEHSKPHPTTMDRSDPMAFGKYLVMNTCSECHGQKLEGNELLKSPSLAVTAGYSNTAFRRLMKTGIAVGGRKLGLMTEVGETRFPWLTEGELEAMQLYLGTTYGNVALARGADDSQPTASHVEHQSPDRS